MRRGGEIGWVTEALAPCRGRLSEGDLRRLAMGIRSVAGIEALVWLTDIAGLSRKEAVEMMRWSAGALLRTALAEKGRAGQRSRRAK